MLQTRDAYWQHGSVCEDIKAIKCPVFAIGGFADGYSDAVLRMLATIQSGVTALLGPWGHDWPDIACPGPQIGYLQVYFVVLAPSSYSQECVKFLRAVETDSVHDGDLRVFETFMVPPGATFLPYY